MYLLPLPDRTRTAVAAMTERRDLYLDALEQLDMMRDRAFKAEAAVRRVRQVAERFASESGPDPYGFGVARAVAADAVLDALDGDG